MKKILIILMIFITIGCGKVKKEPDKIIGTWETKYELSVYKEVIEKYTFKENNECVRTLNTGSEIVNKCTYELDKEKDRIRIIWSNKLDKERYDRYIEIDDDNIMIGNHKYIRKDD